MSVEDLLFWLLAAAVGSAALGVVLSRDVVRTAVWLLAALVGTALLYFLLGAEFLGAAQLIIYVGGTLVLVVFGVMLTARGPTLRLGGSRADWAVTAVVAGGLFGLLLLATRSAPESGGPADLPGAGPLGLAFLGVSEPGPGRPLTGFPGRGEPPVKKPLGYLLAFELISVHLLVALVGAAYLARAKRRPG